MNIELSEKEIRVIRVALYQHWLKMTDDNGDAIKKDFQDFADCCYTTYEKINELDTKKPFDKLDLD